MSQFEAVVKVPMPNPGVWRGSLSLSPIFQIRIEASEGYEFGWLRRHLLSLLFGFKWERKSGQ